MRKIPAHAAIAIAEELSALHGSARSLRVCELAEHYGVASKSINAIARKNGVRARAKRSDAGCSECSQEIIKQVAAKALIGLNLKAEFTNGVRNAMAMLEKEGVKIPVTYSRMCQLLREHGYCREDLAARNPHREMISLHPNHVWEFDVSNCHQWHLKKTGIADLWDFELRIYKNKMQEHFKKNAQQIRRYVMIDHCSGAFYFEYFYAEGERAEDGSKFFFNAFSDKRDLLESLLGVVDNRYQFGGVPDMLVSDKGSILQNGLMKSLMANLDIKVDLHAAGAPWSKGSVEGLMHIIGTHFEPQLKYSRPSSLEELNQWALAWCLEYNNMLEFRNTDLSRLEMWHKGIAGHLRICPSYQVYMSLQQTVTTECKVSGAHIISYDGRQYYVDNVDAAGRKVAVTANAYEWPAITIKCGWDGTVYTNVQPLESDEYGRLISPANATFGEHKGLRKTRRQAAREELEAVATAKYGTQWKGNAAKRQAVAPDSAPLIGSIAHSLRQAGASDIAYLPLAGKEIDLPDTTAPISAAPKIKPMRRMTAPAAATLVPLDDIYRLYVQTYGRISRELREAIAASFPEGADVALTLDEILEFAGGLNANHA